MDLLEGFLWLWGGCAQPSRFAGGLCCLGRPACWSGDIQWCVGPNQASGVRCLVSGSEFWHL